MYHSITFGDKNTWDDWFLIPTSRPVFNPPKPKTTYIDIPGADGHLDMSESLTGEVVYDCRQGSLEFVVDNWHREWHELYSDIMDYLHGKTMRAVLEDDPQYYYEGRFTVNQWKSEPNNSKITIDYIVNPYKFELRSSLEDWEWDSFNFETGIIREYKDLRVDGIRSLVVVGNRKTIIPSFIVESDNEDGMVVEFNGVAHSIPDGLSRIPSIAIANGESVLTFVGFGTISIDYRGGRL